MNIKVGVTVTFHRALCVVVFIAAHADRVPHTGALDFQVKYLDKGGPAGLIYDGASGAPGSLNEFYPITGLTRAGHAFHGHVGIGYIQVSQNYCLRRSVRAVPSDIGAVITKVGFL